MTICTDGGPVKIGCTENLPARHRQLEAHYGRPLALLATMEGDRAAEAQIHDRFAHLRFGRTEQFQPGPDLMAFINRPLFVNQGDVDLMEARNDRETVIHLKGSPEYVDWLEAAHKKTRLPKATIIRIAVEEWAARNQLPGPPEI